MSENIVSTPTRERCVTSYAARTQYKPGEIHPPHIKVKDAIVDRFRERGLSCGLRDPGRLVAFGQYPRERRLPRALPARQDDPHHAHAGTSAPTRLRRHAARPIPARTRKRA